MQADEQQVTDLLCSGVHEADHYRNFMVYIRATSPRRVQCSKPLRSPVAVTLTMELEVAWPAIPYFVPPIAYIWGTALSR